MHQRRQEVEYRGRRRSCVRSAAVAGALLAVQWPMRREVAGGPDTADLVDQCLVPLRLSVVVDLGLIGALVLLGLRLYQLGRIGTTDGDAFRRWARRAWLLVMVAASLDVAENLVLWSRSRSLPPGASDCPALSVDQLAGVPVPLTWLMRAAWVVSLGILLGVVLLAQRGRRQQRKRRGDVLDDAPDEPMDRRAQGGTIICCSGGGIRSASFCLGGLQALREEGTYGRARSVIGVSGGGYIAAAFHALRTPGAVTPAPENTEEPGIAPDPPQPGAESRPLAVFHRRSPELSRLRRQTRYMASSPAVVTRGVLSLLFGLVINVALVAVLLRLAAWVLGWGLADGQVLRGFGTEDASVRFTGDWAWADQVWLLAAAGVGLFVVEKVVLDRLVSAGHAVHTGARALGLRLLWSGVALTALLVGVPHVLAALHDLAVAGGSPSSPGGIASALGFGDPPTTTPAGAAAEVPAGTGRFAGLAAVLAGVLAVAQALKSGGGAESGSEGRFAWLAQLWPRVRDRVLPWVATVAVAATALVVFLLWTRTLALEPASRRQWDVLLLCLLVVAGVKVGTDANSTSLHHFYRERLAKAYLVRRQGGAATNYPYSKPLRFSRAAADHGPALVLAAAANVSDAEWIPTDRHCTPFVFSSDRTGFTDSTLPGAGARPGTALYEWVADPRYRDLTIPAAMAISGAAFSPLAGRKNKVSRPYRLVLALANARLGVWLPNPYWIDAPRAVRRLVSTASDDALRSALSLPDDEREALVRLLTLPQLEWLADQARREEAVTAQRDEAEAGRERVARTQALRGALEAAAEDRQRSLLRNVAEAVTDPSPGALRGLRKVGQVLRSLLDKPGPFRLFKEAFGNSSLFDRKIYVTDGGHYDNLGLVEALRERPEYVVVLDASADPEDSFATLGEAIATARMDLNIDVHFDPRALRRLELERAQVAWGHGRAVHHDGLVTHVLLAKAVKIADLPWDLETYASRNPTFPRTSTGDQLYGEWDFEAYRELGAQVVRKLLADATIPAAPWARPQAAPAPTAVPVPVPAQRLPPVDGWSVSLRRWRRGASSPPGER